MENKEIKEELETYFKSNPKIWYVIAIIAIILLLPYIFKYVTKLNISFRDMQNSFIK